MALSLALSRRASSRPISRQHLGVAFPFRRGSALGPGASMRHSADRISSVFDSPLRDPGADRRHISSLGSAAAVLAGGQALPPDHHAIDSLGSSPSPAPRYGFQLRHDLQLLGSCVRIVEPIKGRPIAFGFSDLSVAVIPAQEVVKKLFGLPIRDSLSGN